MAKDRQVVSLAIVAVTVAGMFMLSIALGKEGIAMQTVELLLNAIKAFGN